MTTTDMNPPGDRIRPRRTPQPLRRTYNVGRKAFLAVVGLTAGALVLGKHASALRNVNFLPGATSVGGFTIYTITDGYPSFDPAAFRLQIDGMVAKPLTMTLSDILRHPAVTEKRFYQCVTGWTVPNATWTGIRLADL